MSPILSDSSGTHREPTTVTGTPPALVMQSYGLSDTGRQRSNNEDHFLVAELAKALRVRHSNLLPAQTQYSGERGYLLIVADGMGGHQAGDQASAVAVETIDEFVLNTFKWFFHLKGPDEENVLTSFQNALHQADARILEMAARHPALYGMGTTLTMAYCVGNEAFIAHVGDSRCYLFRDGRLQLWTRDHTLVAEMVRRGGLAPEDAARHRLRHVILNAVGGNTPGMDIEIHRFDLHPGDTLLLCTDGLTEMVPDDRIAKALAASDDLRTVCERLVAAANEAGGKDNITVIVARFDAAG
jgi:protein phosphatase